MTDFIQVYTTTEKEADADRIAHLLVESRLASCVQVTGPLKSVYWWKGSIEVSKEWLCIIKTRKGLFSQVEECLKHNHPYEVPEIIGVPIEKGGSNYLAWMEEEIKKPDAP